MELKLFNTQKFDDENIQQNWYRINVKEFILKKNSKISIKSTQRAFGLTFPLNFDKNKKYKYIINLDFNIDGKSSDWYQWNKGNVISGTDMYDGYGGYIPFNDKTKPWYDNGQLTGFNYLMDLYKNLVNNDYVIVQLSMTAPESYYFVECNTSDIKTPSKNLCWTPDNPDLDYLKNLFDIIHSGKLPIKLNYNSMACIGYSIGAQAVSRYINEFPFLKTIKNINFPIITSAVLISGGSYLCYGKNNIKNCIDPINKGCCPYNITENNYNNGKLKWNEHPPVLLIQQANDFFADPNASIYYHENMIKNGGPALRISSYTNTHGISNYKQSQQASNFIHNIFNPVKKSDFRQNHIKINILSLIFLIIFSLLFVVSIFYTISEKNIKYYYNSLFLFIGIIVTITYLFKNNNNLTLTDKILNKQNIINNHQKVITKKNILDKINANGILITVNSTNLYCPEYKETLKTCPDKNVDPKCTNFVSDCPLGSEDNLCKCLEPSQCTLWDVGDVEQLLNYNLQDAGTSCFACDTTYLNKNLPPALFGPYLYWNGLGKSYPIGFILDFDNLKKHGYIACGYSFDAGSVGRIPPDAIKLGIYDEQTANKCLSEALNITDDDLLNGKLHVGDKDKISPLNCPASVMAGCINYDATYKPAKKIPDLDNLPTSLIQSCVDNPNEKCVTSSAFGDPRINPYFELDDNGLKHFKEYSEKIQSILGKQSRTLWTEDDLKNFYSNNDKNIACPDYFANEIPTDVINDNVKIGVGQNGYKESEVILFVPQKPGTNIKISCHPTKKFKKVWRESILGLFTNNICYQNVKYNNATKKFPTINNHCCSDDFNIKLVKKLVDKYNNNSNNIINGYVINTVKPGERIEAETNSYNYDSIITQITNY